MHLKKYIPVSLIMLVFVMVLAACGNQESGTGAENKSEAETVSQTGGTKTYETVKGEVEIPAEPDRIVVTEPDYVGYLLALGVKPVGTASFAFENPFYKEQLSGVEEVGDRTSTSFEKVLSLEPDLIVTYNKEAYEKLSSIAPTVLIPWGQYDYRELVQEFGKILGKEAEAKDWLAQFDKQVAESKAKITEAGLQDDKAAIVEITDKDIYIYGDSYGRGGELIYNELQLSPPAIVKKEVFPDGWKSVSQEVLPEYLGEADHIFVGVRDGAENRSSQIRKKGIWTDLPAVQKGNVYEYNLDTFYFSDPLSLEGQLDIIVDRLVSGNKK